MQIEDIDYYQLPGDEASLRARAVVEEFVATGGYIRPDLDIIRGSGDRSFSTWGTVRADVGGWRRRELGKAAHYERQNLATIGDTFKSLELLKSSPSSAIAFLARSTMKLQELVSPKYYCVDVEQGRVAVLWHEGQPSREPMLVDKLEIERLMRVSLNSENAHRYGFRYNINLLLLTAFGRSEGFSAGVARLSGKMGSLKPAEVKFNKVWERVTNPNFLLGPGTDSINGLVRG